MDFRTKTEKREYMRRAKDKALLTDEEHAIITPWLPEHPSWVPGWGLSLFNEWNGRTGTLVVLEQGGVRRLTSYKKFFLNKDSSFQRRLATAGRLAVESDVKLLRQDGYDVHHEGMEYNAILKAFMTEHTNPELRKLTRGGWAFADPEHFRQFHNARCTLVAIPTEEHRRMHSTQVEELEDGFDADAYLQEFVP